MKNLNDEMLPFVSIITVSFNAVDTIEKTIKSVLSQSYSNIEYIIIDGCSTDGTIDVIRKYKSRIDYWISESDNGIYDAMNKGIKLAHGEWINFMNCGDIFYSKDVLSSLFEHNNVNEVGVIYGKTLLCLSFEKYILTPEPLSVLPNHIPFCHQSSFVKAALLKEYEFNTKFKIVADQELFLRLFRKNVQFRYFSIVISSYYPEGGYSYKNKIKAFKETLLLEKKRRIIIDSLRFLYLCIRILILKLLPINISNVLKKMQLSKLSNYEKVN